MNLDKTIHYCKADKKTGTPVIISTYIGGNMVETKKVKKWTMNLFDKEGKPIRFEIEFNNAVGNGKRSGATTMFKIFKQWFFDYDRRKRKM